MTNYLTILKESILDADSGSTSLFSDALYSRLNEENPEVFKLSRQAQMIVEDRLDFVKDQFRNKMDFEHDTTGKIKDSDALIDHIAAKVDPTPTKVHTQWVTGQYKGGKIRQEDFPRVKKALKGFESVKKNLVTKDINQFKTVGDLEDHVATQAHRTAADTKDKEATKSAGNPDQLEKIHETEHGTGFKIPNQKVSTALYGPAGKLAKTNWCTASAGSNNMFNHYAGGKYTYHTPENNVLQIHHNSNQIMDSTNTRINLNSDHRFAPHAQDIKEFVKSTGDKEGFKDSPSPLMKSVGAGITHEQMLASEQSANARMQPTSYGQGSISNSHRESLQVNPHTPEHFEKVADFIHRSGGAKGSGYDDHIEAQHALAQNPNTPSHVLKQIHDLHQGLSDGFHQSATIKGHLAKNENLDAQTRSELKEIPSFGSRRDLTEPEISHIVNKSDNHATPEHKNELAKNSTVSLSPEHQATLMKTNSGDILGRVDLHHSIAEEALASDKNEISNYRMPHIASKVSPEYLSKNLDKTALAPKEIYNREDVSPEVHEHIVKSGKLQANDIRPEHATMAVESGKYTHASQLNIPGISKEHATTAALGVHSDEKMSNYTREEAYKHPKVSDEVKTKLIGKIAANDTYRNKDVGEKYHNIPAAHISEVIKNGTPVAKHAVISAKNIQKSHFDELMKEPSNHAAIVNAKSAPPSILSQLANSPSDYIKSKVASHKNTPADVKASIKFDERKI